MPEKQRKKNEEQQSPVWTRSKSLVWTRSNSLQPERGATVSCLNEEQQSPVWTRSNSLLSERGAAVSCLNEEQQFPAWTRSNSLLPDFNDSCILPVLLTMQVIMHDVSQVIASFTIFYAHLDRCILHSNIRKELKQDLLLWRKSNLSGN